ncbi:MAG: ABC transporter ATP-binding protein, partial [Armatimonadetes bacterium]|nr:ABC transporter ATP-binding protein [Armatimonadota bacterium]
MDLLARIKQERGLAVVLITHDLGIVSQFADRAAVMYAGQIVEQARVSDLIAEPLHPYTQGLLRCVPRLGRPDLPITPIEGSVPDLSALPPGCRFAPRCPEAMDHCREGVPPMHETPTGRLVRCCRPGATAEAGSDRRERT